MNHSSTLTETAIPLISFMSAHFLLNSYTFIADTEPAEAATVMKTASDHYLEMNFRKSNESSVSSLGGSEGYIVYDKPDFDFSEIFKTKPKLVVVLYKTAETAPPEFVTKLVIPPSVSFFVVLLTQNEASGRCFRLYKPSSMSSSKSFPVMKYGGETPKWDWDTNQTDWNSFEKETRNMSGVTITIALASYFEKKTVIERFWAGKNSFFWREMQRHLKFRATVHFESISPTALKDVGEVSLSVLGKVADGLGFLAVMSAERARVLEFILTGLDSKATLHFQSVSPTALKGVGEVYLSMLGKVADGLGLLPVMSAERVRVLEFILTGLDSKYHLLVRTPQYVHSWQSVFKPFTSEAWICLGIAIVLLTASLKIVTLRLDKSLQDLSSCFLTIFGFICSQGCPHIPETSSARIVCYTSIFFSILIYHFYTSNFYSLLSTKEVTLPFTSLEQFIARKTHFMYIHPETAIYAHIVKAQNGTLKKLWDEFLSKDPSHKFKVSTKQKSLERVCKGKAAIFGLPFQSMFSQDLKCKLVTVNSGYFPTNIITAVRKNFPFKSQFKFVHMRLLESGVSHKFRDEKIAVEQQYGKEEVINEPVSMEHVAFLFAFLACFVILSFVLLALEMVASKTLKGRKDSLKGRLNKTL